MSNLLDEFCGFIALIERRLDHDFPDIPRVVSTKSAPRNKVFITNHKCANRSFVKKSQKFGFIPGKRGLR